MKTQLNDSGFSLIDALMAVALVGFITFGAMTFVATGFDSVSRQEMMVTQNRLAENLVRVISTPASLRSTIRGPDADPVLKACINGNGPACPSGGQYLPTRISFPMVIALSPTSVLDSGPITGTQSQPFRFNTKGEACDTRVNSCPASIYPLEAFTQFSAVCPPIFDSSYDGSLRGGKPYYGPLYPDGIKTGTSCSQARSINVLLVVRPSIDGTTLPRHPLPTIRKIVSIDVRKINLTY